MTAQGPSMVNGGSNAGLLTRAVASSRLAPVDLCGGLRVGRLSAWVSLPPIKSLPARPAMPWKQA